jgi:tetratricopeptide (TPR) repeat protein
VLGPEHPDTALILNNLAVLYDHVGNYAKAEPLLRQTLQIWQKVRGPKHPDIALILNKLAVLYEQVGDYTKAEPFYQQALQIRTKVLGPEHPNTATSLKPMLPQKLSVLRLANRPKRQRRKYNRHSCRP